MLYSRKGESKMNGYPYQKGQQVIFQSSKYPQLAPYVVTIHAVNLNAGTAHPYYKYKHNGTISEWEYFPNFKPIPEPNELGA
jgi:hypothetical protein